MEMSSNSTHRECRRRRLLLFPLPFQGHINPMFQLANILHSRGYGISIIHTQFNSPDPSNYPHLKFHVIPDGMSHSQFSPNALLFFIDLMNKKCSYPFQQCLAQLLSSEDGHNYMPCIITDAVWYFTQDVADKFNLKRIALRTSNASSFLAFAALPSLRQRGFRFNDASCKMDDKPIPELPQLKMNDIPSLKGESMEDLCEYITKMNGAAKKSSCLIFNTFKELEEADLAKIQYQFNVPIFAIGPFHKCFSAANSSLLKHDRSSIDWLDKQEPKSVVYVSFGSAAAMDENDILEVAWGLVNSKQPFLWVVRPGIIPGLSWLESLPNEVLSGVGVRDRCHVVKWAPQQEVLGHPAVSAFFTHSGWNSTLESICEGVPMICSSFFGDQMVDSRWVSDVWRIGVKLENGLQRGEIQRAITTVMLENEGQEMRQRVINLKQMGQNCLNPAGSSYKAVDELLTLISSFQS